MAIIKARKTCGTDKAVRCIVGGLPGGLAGRGDGASVSSVGSSCSPPPGSEEFSDASQELIPRGMLRGLTGGGGSGLRTSPTDMKGPSPAPISRRRFISGRYMSGTATTWICSTKVQCVVWEFPTAPAYPTTGGAQTHARS